jgi:ribosomal protein L27
MKRELKTGKSKSQCSILGQHLVRARALHQHRINNVPIGLDVRVFSCTILTCYLQELNLHRLMWQVVKHT